MSSLSNSAILSVKSGSSKRLSLNTIESSVTRLLVSTKHLLESLTQWARQEADDKFVSDAYVKLGNDFRAAARAFTSAGVDISDLGDVPKALRIVLESALSEVPTQESLDKFMPNVRNIIVNLLLTLKMKQLKAKELSEQTLKGNSINAQNASTSSSTSPKAKESMQSYVHESVFIPPEKPIDNKELADKVVLSEDLGNQKPKSNEIASKAALAQLQKGNAVLRRASKRFSAYQFAKLANYSGNQLPRIVSESSSSVPSATKRVSRDASEMNISERSEESDSSTMCLFLRIGDRTKKVEAQLPITLASIRLLFVEKFAYSPGTTSFPDIYVLDPEHNILFELEDVSLLSEVKNGTLLVLKSIEKEAEIKESLKEIVDDFGNRLEKVVQSVLQDVKESLNNAKSQPVDTTVHKVEKESETENFKVKFINLSKDLHEVIEELTSIKSAQNQKKIHVSGAVKELMLELSALKESSFSESGATSNRDYMQHSYSKLSDDSDNLLTKVDDLQDMMEALRKDVAQRGVRIGPQQLKSTRKEIDDAKSSLKGLDDFITDGKPTWKKIWESELDKVCEEQQFFNLQDDLTLDLKEDIKKIEETFDLIEKCSVEQSKSTSKRKFSSKVCLIEPGESIHSIKDALLNEVATLVPNHESRLEAIEKAERLRQKEREITQMNEFQEELGDFVEEKRLKNSGGIEELERKRQQKDIENLKSSFGVI